MATNAVPNAATPSAVNLSELQKLRDEIDQMKTHMKVKQASCGAMESLAISTLVRMNKRSVGMQQGRGFYITLHKKTSEGSWNVDRQKDFFQTVLVPKMTSGQITTADQYVTEIDAYLSQFQKRSLGLSIVTRPPKEQTCEDLVQWVNGQDEAKQVQHM
jgi:hypothetical protein